MAANSTATIRKNEQAVQDSAAYVADENHVERYAEVQAIDAQIKALQDARAELIKPVRNDMETLGVSKIVDKAGATLYTLSTANVKNFQTKEFKTDFPEMYGKYVKETTRTTFKVV